VAEDRRERDFDVRRCVRFAFCEVGRSSSDAVHGVSISVVRVREFGG
jgi:hypothetical protein